MATQRRNKRWLKLANGSLTAKPSNKPGTGVGISLRFDLATFTFRRFALFERTIQIGVKEAELVLRLKSGEMPDEDWLFDAPNESERDVSYEVKDTLSRIAEDGRTNEISSTLTLGFDAKEKTTKAIITPSFAAKRQTQKNWSQSDAFNRTLKFSAMHRFIFALGNAKRPRWLITCPPEFPVLRGPALKAERFARFCSRGKQARIDMLVEIPEHAIVIRDESGAFETANKRIVALRRVAKEISTTELKVASLHVEDTDD